LLKLKFYDNVYFKGGEKMATEQITVSIAPETYKELRQWSEKEKRSLSNAVDLILSLFFAQQK